MDLTSLLPAALIVAIVLGVVAVGVAVAALATSRRVRAASLSGRAPVAADSHAEQRRAYANLLRRYSEILGVEIVTGRIPNRGDTSVDLRVQLETALRTVREPGAVELLDEVGDARDALQLMPRAQRAAENGLVAMRVEWSIERWAAHPRTWLADCREQARLEQLAHRAAAQAEPRALAQAGPSTPLGMSAPAPVAVAS
jgi:hypothetical protein